MTEQQSDGLDTGREGETTAAGTGLAGSSRPSQSQSQSKKIVGPAVRAAFMLINAKLCSDHIYLDFYAFQQAPQRPRADRQPSHC